MQFTGDIHESVSVFLSLVSFPRSFAGKLQIDSIFARSRISLRELPRDLPTCRGIGYVAGIIPFLTYSAPRNSKRDRYASLGVTRSCNRSSLLTLRYSRSAFFFPSQTPRILYRVFRQELRDQCKFRVGARILKDFYCSPRANQERFTRLVNRILW